MSKQPNIFILYGTERGNAFTLAEILTSRLDRFELLNPKIMSLNEFSDPDRFVPGDLVILVCSTTGQGELPRNTKIFWRKLLKRKLTNTFLNGIEFTSFGLGDSSYPRYQWAIRKLHSRFSQLGAHEFVSRGEADEMNPDGIDYVFENWMNLLVEKLKDSYQVGQERDIHHLPKSRNALKINKDSSIKLPVGRRIIDGSDGLRFGKLVANTRMTSSDHFQDVRYFAIEKQESDLDDFEYEPGDTVALFPQNNASDVQALIDHQKWNDICDFPCNLNSEKASSNGKVSPLTLRTLLTYQLDIMCIPNRAFFSLIWHFCDDEREKEKLLEFSTLQGLQDLYDYADRPRRSIVETILEFDSLKIPVEYLLDLIPPLRSREFSIASEANCQTLELAIAIVKYKTIIRRIRRGVCSQWVESLNEGDPIPFKIQRNDIMATASKKVDLYKTPLLMIAPGTGVAPMRSLILTRRERSEGSSTGEALLFIGCRYQNKDYLFHKDWKKLSKDHSVEIIPAFSREGGGYVQTQLSYHSKRVYDLIVNQQALIYLCGSSGSMPRQVNLTLIDILTQCNDQWDEKEAEKYLMTIEKQGRYLQETW